MSRALVRILVFLVRVYQVALSPHLGGQCRFFPSCSNYAVQALEAHGALGGICLTSRRLLRCHPLSAGGYDPVLKRENRGP